MEMHGQITWRAETGKAREAPVTYFVYDPAMGLMDADFHPLDDAGWKNMRAAGKNAIAEVELPPDTEILAIERLIRLISSRGGYGIIEVKMRNPE